MSTATKLTLLDRYLYYCTLLTVSATGIDPCSDVDSEAGLCYAGSGHVLASGAGVVRFMDKHVNEHTEKQSMRRHVSLYAAYVSEGQCKTLPLLTDHQYVCPYPNFRNSFSFRLKQDTLRITVIS